MDLTKLGHSGFTNSDLVTVPCFDIVDKYLRSKIGTFFMKLLEFVLIVRMHKKHLFWYNTAINPTNI
jgi:hypothetical protein